MSDLKGSISTAVRRFTFATVGARGDIKSPADLPAGAVGIEVTDPAFAAALAVNIDPQHGGQKPAYGAAPGDAAIDVAFFARDLFDGAQVLVTTRPDLDSVGAMAVVACRDLLGWGNRAVGARIEAVSVADSFAVSNEPWNPSSLPTRDRPWGDERGSVDSRRELAAINAAVQDSSVPLAQRVEWTAWWLATGEEPGGYRDRVEATRLRLVEQITPESVRVVLDAMRCGACGRTVSAVLPAVMAPRGEWACPECMSEGCFDGCPLLALVEVDHPGATGLGYCLAPVVVARAPRGPLAGKYTIAAWGDHIDHAALRVALRERDGRAWGGPPTLTAYGPPSNPDTSPLAIDEVAAIVRSCLREVPLVLAAWLATDYARTPAVAKGFATYGDQWLAVYREKHVVEWDTSDIPPEYSAALPWDGVIDLCTVPPK